jgi:hypothetical protein
MMPNEHDHPADNTVNAPDPLPVLTTGAGMLHHLFPTPAIE